MHPFPNTTHTDFPRKIQMDSRWTLVGFHLPWVHFREFLASYTLILSMENPDGVQVESCFNNKPSVLNTFLTDCTEQNTSNLKYYILRLSTEIPDGV